MTKLTYDSRLICNIIEFAQGPWNDSAVSMDTYNAGGTERAPMSPKMRWKAMNNSTPRDSRLRNLIATGDQCSANKNIIRQLPKVLSNENIAAAAVASVIREQYYFAAAGKQSNCFSTPTRESKVMESPTNVHVLVEAATQISKPIDSIRQHMRQISANGGKPLTPSKSKNLLKQLETATNM